MAKILVVEDDLVIQRILVMRLQQWGHETIVAGDGETAVTLATTQKPDLIFMDMRLPIMDGWEATRRIKDNDTTSHIPVIALTAASTIDEKIRLTNSGCNGYLSKPVSADTLKQAIAQYLPK